MLEQEHLLDILLMRSAGRYMIRVHLIEAAWSNLSSSNRTVRHDRLEVSVASSLRHSKLSMRNVSPDPR